MDLLIKSRLFAAALILVPVPAAFAQGIIARLGVNMANAVTNPQPASPSNREYREGINAAMLGEFGHGPARLLVGAGYEHKGMHITGPGGGDIRLDYVTVPVMISLGTPGSFEAPRLFVNAGVESAVLLSSDYAADDFTFAIDNAEKFDFGLRGEIGLEVPMSAYGPAGLIGMGYTYGLTDANSGDEEWNNYVITAFFGLKIRTL